MSWVDREEILSLFVEAGRLGRGEKIGGPRFLSGLRLPAWTTDQDWSEEVARARAGLAGAAAERALERGPRPLSKEEQRAKWRLDNRARKVRLRRIDAALRRARPVFQVVAAEERREACAFCGTEVVWREGVRSPMVPRGGKLVFAPCCDRMRASLKCG